MRDSAFFLTCVGRQTMRKRKHSAQRFRHPTAPGQILAIDGVAQLVTKQRLPGHRKMLLCSQATDSLSRLTLCSADLQN